MEIIRETPDYIAVYKQAGIAVESRSFGRIDLEHELLNLLARRQSGSGGNDGSGIPYLAVINRLDQPVEGIVLFAKNKQAAAELSNQMQTHRMKKEYLAVVRTENMRAGDMSSMEARTCDNSTGLPGREGLNGGSEKEYTELVDYLLKDGRTNTSKVVPEKTKGAKKAVLSYTCEARRDDLALLRVRLQTVRHHQIRVQLAHAGMPIAGDRKYGGAAAPARIGTEQGTDGSRYAADTPALCAVKLSFYDPSDKNREVVLEIRPKGELFSVFM